MLVGKLLQLAVGPGIENPILDVGPGILSLVLGLIPAVGNRGEESVAVALSTLLDVDALLLEVGAQLLGIPLLVGRDGILIPVLLDQVLEVLAVGGGGVGDVVVAGSPWLAACISEGVLCVTGLTKASAQSRFRATCCTLRDVSKSTRLPSLSPRRIRDARGRRAGVHLPALVNQLLPRTTSVAKANDRTVESNLMMGRQGGDDK